MILNKKETIFIHNALCELLLACRFNSKAKIFSGKIIRMLEKIERREFIKITPLCRKCKNKGSIRAKYCHYALPMKAKTCRYFR